MADPIHTAFVGGDEGPYRVERVTTVCGPSIASVPRLGVHEDATGQPLAGSGWVLRGVTAHQHYTERHEHTVLAATQPPLGRREASCAALIPIRKSAAWWDLSQDERRAIFEEESRHIAIGVQYLPAIARRLYHSRLLGQPFDFLTWFEFAPAEAAGFDELLGELRRTREWSFVEREVEIRLLRDGQS